MIQAPFAGIQNPFHPVMEERKYLQFEDAIQCAIIAFYRDIKPSELNQFKPKGVINR